MIRFLLNREKIAIDPRADLTVLDYLREHRGHFAAKEGCASGDCGACTVVIASPLDAQLTYRAVNSCIMMVGALHGKQLLTAEHLVDAQAGDSSTGDSHSAEFSAQHSTQHSLDTLHAVQRAMVEQHASQCGFCTPGFVMALFALYKSRAQHETPTRTPLTRDEIEAQLGGNLCRCTGYRPIIDAAVDACTAPTDDQFSIDEKTIAAQLCALAKQQPRTQRFFAPRNVAQLTAHWREHPQARLLGGGTDMALEATQQLNELPSLIALDEVVELQQIESDDAHLHIGAAMPLAQCTEVLCAEYPQLRELLHRFGSAQIRNCATLGGNLANASPVADLSPLWLALDAVVVAQQEERVRHIAIDDFFIAYKQTALQPHEFIRAVIVPRRAPDVRLAAYKVSKRIDDDISAVCAVFCARLDGRKIVTMRAAFGGMAATPKRASGVEHCLTGDVFDDDALARAQRAITDDFTPLDDVRAGAQYRITVARNLLRRLHLQWFAPEIQTRVPPVAPLNSPSNVSSTAASTSTLTSTLTLQSTSKVSSTVPSTSTSKVQSTSHSNDLSTAQPRTS